MEIYILLEKWDGLHSFLRWGIQLLKYFTVVSKARRQF